MVAFQSSLEEPISAETSERHIEAPWIWDGTPEEQFKSFSETSAPFRKMYSIMNSASQQIVTNEILSAIGRYYDGQRVNFTAMLNTAKGRKTN